MGSIYLLDPNSIYGRLISNLSIISGQSAGEMANAARIVAANKIYHFSDRKTLKCGDCRDWFSIKVGTIFEDTKLPLRKWFMAIWLITNHPKGVASVTLAKDLRITQKSAWFMLHRLRHTARTNSFNAPLKSDIEADITFIGGKEKKQARQA
jgi:hypothetical protein